MRTAGFSHGGLVSSLVGSLVGALLLLGGCSSTPMSTNEDAATGPQCPSDLPPSCPVTFPSYQADIAPLVQRQCLACHRDGGIEANRPLDTYSNLYSERGAVLHQIYGCLMPPPVAPQLDATERQQILTWLICQAPNN